MIALGFPNGKGNLQKLSDPPLALEGLGNEGKAIGHDSVFTKLDVVETGRCPRLNGCTLFLALPDSYATWKPVEAVSGISKIVTR